MTKTSYRKMEKPPLDLKGTPAKMTAGTEDKGLRSARRTAEDPSTSVPRQKSWSTPRRKPGDMDRGGENTQRSGTLTKLKPQALFTPPKHYREEVWPRTTSSALAPINLNGIVAGKEGRQGKAASAGSPAGDLVPSVSASGRRVQFGTKQKQMKGKELLSESLEVDGRLRVVWSNPTFCAEGLPDQRDSSTGSCCLDSCGADADERDEQVVEEPTFLSLTEFQESVHNASHSSKDLRFADDDAASMAAGLSHVAGRGSLGASSVSASERDRTSVNLSGEDVLSVRLDNLEAGGVIAGLEQDTIVATVERDLEAEIRRNIEDEIAAEIRSLSERLAELHARQGVQQSDRAQCPDVALSCPQTPILATPKDRVGKVQFLEDFLHDADGCATSSIRQSPAKAYGVEPRSAGNMSLAEASPQPAAESDACKGRKGRIVSAKFLDWSTTKNAGKGAVGSPEKKPYRGGSSGTGAPSPQFSRRGVSLGGATSVPKRREASAHSPHPHVSKKPEHKNAPSFSVGGQGRCQVHAEENEGAKTPHTAASSCVGKSQKSGNQCTEESSSKSVMQNGVMTVWQSLGLSKRFDWIKTLRSGAQMKPARLQGLAATVEDGKIMDDQDVLAKPAAIKVSPGRPSLLEKIDTQAQRSAGSRLVASRYGVSPVSAGGQVKDKPTNAERIGDARIKREGLGPESGRKPTVRSGYPTPGTSSPAKPLRNENSKSRASPKENALSGGHRLGGGGRPEPWDSIARDDSKKHPNSAGKKQIGKSLQQQGWESIAAEAKVSKDEISGPCVHKRSKEEKSCRSSSPVPICDLISRFNQLDLKKSNVTAKVTGPASATKLGRHVPSSRSAVSPCLVQPARVSALQVDVPKTPGIPLPSSGPRSRVRSPYDDFKTPDDLISLPDYGMECPGEQFRTPSVLLSPPPVGSTIKDMLPVVTELRSRLESSPVLKKFSDLMKDIDSLETERLRLPKIATKGFLGISPRDSGCVKRASERSGSHPFSSIEACPVPVELGQLDGRQSELNLECLAAQLVDAAVNREQADQGLLVGCLETYAKDGKWENGALMHHLKEDTGTFVVPKKVGDDGNSGDATEKSELEKLWHLVERLDKERRDSVYEMLSRQLAKVQQDQL